MNVRLIIQKGFVAVLAAMALSSCDWFHEDLDDCPTGLYVNFVYDYNIQQADMFKDHVGGLTLYVYDESDRLVATKSMGESQLSKYGSYMHFSEEELAPGHNYRLMAVAFQNSIQSSNGAKYRQTGNGIGDEWKNFFINLDHNATRYPAHFSYVSNVAPLDTLWHTLTTITTPADAFPKELYPASLTPAKTDYSWQRDGSIKSNGMERVSLVKGEPTYATVSLIRDTKHLNISLRVLNYYIDEKTFESEDNIVLHEDYSVEIIDNNSQLDCQNNLSNPNDTIIYTPYHEWTTSFVGTDGVATESAAHYDLMFNRLLYKNASVENDKYAVLNEADIAKSTNALLIIRNKQTGKMIFGINLPYLLSSGRTYQERYYHYQEYLDREYDYRLQFILRGEEIGDILLYLGDNHVHTIPWALRQQHESF